MEKDYTLKVWNTLTECYEEVMVIFPNSLR